MPDKEKDIYDHENFDINRGTVVNWKIGLLGWSPPAIGLAACAYSHFSDSPINSLCLNLLAFLGVTAICVFLHELGHFLAARLLGLNPLCLEVGSGDAVFDHEFRKFRLLLRLNPYCGAVFPACFEAGRASQFLMVAAGPAINAGLALVGYFFVSRDPANWELQTDYHTFSVVLLLANVYLLAISMYPYEGAMNGMSTPSDGLLLWYLLTNTVPQPRFVSSPGETTPIPSWRLMVETQTPDAMLKMCREGLRLPDLPSEDRISLFDGFATAVLMYGSAEHLEEADRYSEELIQLAPESWTAKGTRGGILVETGQLKVGSDMLLEVFENSSSDLDKTISASFLALAEYRQGNSAKAHKWIAISREIDPNCASMIRIEKTLKENITG